MNKNKYFLIVAIALIAVISNQTKAEMIDLTDPDNQIKDSLTFNEGTPDEYDVWFYWMDASSTGTGVIDPFVRLGTNDPIEQGYNTDYRGKDPKFPEFDEDNSPHTSSLNIASVPLVNLDGILYREFLLDINQNNKEGESLLSLDVIKIYLYENGMRNDYASGWGDPIFDLDSEEDNYVLLDYALNHGSGSGDMLLYVPNSLFEGGAEFVYLYSLFGQNNSNNSGFEEWYVREGAEPPVVPVPGAAILGMIGLIIAGKKLRKYA